MVVWNLFAFRSTDPKALRAQTDPVGPENDLFVREAFGEARKREGLVVAAWGSHGTWMDRHASIMQLAAEARVRLYCFGLTKGGLPKHPLYIPYSAPLVRLSH
ncbi:MAG: DUF1643 domain-containing protein [Bauldia sp.]